MTPAEVAAWMLAHLHRDGCVYQDDVVDMLTLNLKKAGGFIVSTATDGASGLKKAREELPALIILDLMLPKKSGFEVLDHVRRVSKIPVILLTSLQERAHMRIGMTTGADDYITKPFRPGELREAVAAQLNKRQVQANLQALAIHQAVNSALVEQRHALARLYEQRLAAQLSERWPVAAGDASDERFESATVLFVDFPHYAGVAEKLSAGELTELVKKFYGSANDTAHLFGARFIQFVGEGLLAVFTDDTNTRTVNHSLRAVRTALGLLESGRGLRGYLEASYAGRQLPPFSVNVALNTGPVTLTLLQDPLHGDNQRLPVGEVVSTTMQLQKQARALGWPVAASVTTARAVTGAVQAGRRALLALAERSQPLDTVEILGLALPAQPA